MSRSIEEKSKKMRRNEIGEMSVLAALSFDQIFGNIPTNHVQKIKYGKWGLKSPLSKWH